MRWTGLPDESNDQLAKECPRSVFTSSFRQLGDKSQTYFDILGHFAILGCPKICPLQGLHFLGVVLDS